MSAADRVMEGARERCFNGGMQMRASPVIPRLSIPPEMWTVQLCMMWIFQSTECELSRVFQISLLLANIPHFLQHMHNVKRISLFIMLHVWEFVYTVLGHATTFFFFFFLVKLGSRSEDFHGTSLLMTVSVRLITLVLYVQLKGI